jgi:hypothetical protein
MFEGGSAGSSIFSPTHIRPLYLGPMNGCTICEQCQSWSNDTNVKCAEFQHCIARYATCDPIRSSSRLINPYHTP